MRLIIALVMVSIFVVSQGFAGSLVSLQSSGTPIAGVAELLTEQTGVAVVVDPSIEAKITVSFKDTELSKAVDLIAKLNDLQWKKVKFTRPAQSNVTLEQIKSAILALAAIQINAIAIEDPASKTFCMAATNLPEFPDTTNVKVPEGYKWVDAYVILPKTTTPAKADAASEQSNKLKQLCETNRGSLLDIAVLSSNDRRQVFADEWMSSLSLTPEARRALIVDRMRAINDLPEQYRSQIKADLQAANRLMSPKQNAKKGGKK